MGLTASLRDIGRVLTERNYRLYFAGNSLSIIGAWIHRTALGWLTWELTGSPAWLGTIAFWAMFPAVFIAPFAGALGDRIGTRRVAVCALLANGTNLALLSLFVFSDLLSIELLLVQTIVFGCAFGFDLPARSALVPAVVSRGDLPTAIALNTTMFHLGMFAGPALFGLINLHLEIAWAFVINAVSYFFYAFCLTRMRLDEARLGGAGVGAILADLAEGVAYILAKRGILALITLAATVHLLLRPYTDLLPGFSAQVFGLGASGYATFLSTIGAGALLGGVWLVLRGGMGGLTRILLTGVLGTALSLVVFTSSDSFWVAETCMFLSGFFLVCQAVASQSLVQGSIEPALRGRVISVTTAIAIGFPALGALILGQIGDVTGVQAPVLGAALLAIVLWLVLAPRLRRWAGELESPDRR